jgi:hypothetical protein
VRSLLTLLIVFSSMLVAGASGDAVRPVTARQQQRLGGPGQPGGAVRPGLHLAVRLCASAEHGAERPGDERRTHRHLLLGWALLDQQLGTLQLVGGAVVVCGIVLLTYRRAHDRS